VSYRLNISTDLQFSDQTRNLYCIIILMKFGHLIWFINCSANILDGFWSVTSDRIIHDIAYIIICHVRAYLNYVIFRLLLLILGLKVILHVLVLLPDLIISQSSYLLPFFSGQHSTIFIQSPFSSGKSSGHSNLLKHWHFLFSPEAAEVLKLCLII
jgi:hypothetical protein